NLARAAGPARSGFASRGSTAAYWMCTLVIAWEMAAGSMWDLLQINYVRAVFTHLGYPHYMLFIIGVWKLPCALVLLLPRFLRLKEWAYAGAIFNYSGAFASHSLVGDGPKLWAGPVVFALITLASWALRPPDRRLESAREDIETPPAAWIIPIVVALVM